MSQEECFKVLQKFQEEWFSAHSVKNYLEKWGNPVQTINSYNVNLKRLSKMDCIEVKIDKCPFNSHRMQKYYRYVKVEDE